MDTYIKENQKKKFWPWSKCTHSLKRFDPGCGKYRRKFDLLNGCGKFIRLRRYEGPDGEIRRTVEVEI